MQLLQTGIVQNIYIKMPHIYGHIYSNHFFNECHVFLFLIFNFFKLFFSILASMGKKQEIIQLIL